MRFKNLTITLTLTCLSIVAIAGLALLPTPTIEASWTELQTSDGVTTSSFSQSCGGTSAGWSVCASVSAGPGSSGADALCGIRNPTRFPMGEKGIIVGEYDGAATVTASRGAVFVYVGTTGSGSSAKSCANRWI